MYFDPEPKTRIEDFFNMEEELKSFTESLNKEKLIVVTGLRRYGKTSLILTGLNISGSEYLFLDCRLLPSGIISIRDFLILLEDELNRRSWTRRILHGVEEVSIGDFGLRIRRMERNTFLKLVERLKGKILVLDEAQELRRSNYNFNDLIAYIYDHLDLKVIVSGSKIGLLYNFLKVNDPEAPLFGRPYMEVKLGKLSPQKAKEFLVRGFEQEKVKISDDIIEEAVRKFDGVIGWLTYFGHSYARSRETISMIVEKASKLSANEVNHALNIYGIGRERYVSILKIVASSEGLRWSEIKRAFEAKHGRIPNNTLSNIIKNLVNQGLLEKIDDYYEVTDPILKIGISRYLSYK
ncbi:MAG: ATP-binding protein [Candidatus Methanomethylicia archaeon]